MNFSTFQSTSFLKLPHPDDQLDLLFSPEIKLNFWPSSRLIYISPNHLMFILSPSQHPSPPSHHLPLTNTLSPSHLGLIISLSRHRTISQYRLIYTKPTHPPSSHSTAKALRGWATPSFPRRPSLPNIDFACFLCFWQTALPLSRPRPWVIIFGAQGYLNIWQIIQILRSLGHIYRIFGELFARLSRFQGHFGNTSLNISLIIW